MIGFSEEVKELLTPDAETKGSAMMAVALNRTHSRIYEGTVPAHIKAQRRAKNKRARKARRLNRK